MADDFIGAIYIYRDEIIKVVAIRREYALYVRRLENDSWTKAAGKMHLNYLARLEKL